MRQIDVSLIDALEPEILETIPADLLLREAAEENLFEGIQTGKPPNAPEGWEEVEFQTRVKQGLINGFIKGHKKGRIISPTGSGKTTMSVDVMTQIFGPHLILAPSIAAAERFAEELESRGEKPLRLKSSNFHKIFSSRFVVCTGQTLMPTKSREGLMMAIPQNHFKHVWVDEAHHFFGKKMSQVPARFTHAYTAYITATPDTQKNQLADVAPYLYGEIKYKELIDKFGYPKRRFFQHSVSGENWDKVRIVANEVKFQDEEEGNVKGLNMPARYGVLHRIVSSVMTQECPGIAFMPSIKSSEHFIKNYIDPNPELKGKVKLVHGKMSKKARQVILDQINNGELLCVLTTHAWAESVDIPRLKHVVMADNVHAPWLETQRVGRGTRKHPAKNGEVWIHDIAGYMANGGKRANSLVRSLTKKLPGRRLQQGLNLDDQDSDPIDPKILAALELTTCEIPLSDWAYEVDFTILRDQPELTLQLVKDFANHFEVPPFELLVNHEHFLDRDDFILCEFDGHDEELEVYFRDLWNFIKLFRMEDLIADMLFDDIDELCTQFAEIVEAAFESEGTRAARKHYSGPGFAEYLDRDNFVYEHPHELKILKTIEYMMSDSGNWDTTLIITDREATENENRMSVLFQLKDIPRHIRPSTEDWEAYLKNPTRIEQLAVINGMYILTYEDSINGFMCDRYSEPVTLWNPDGSACRSTEYEYYINDIEEHLKPLVDPEFYELIKAAVIAGKAHLQLDGADASRFIKDIYTLLVPHPDGDGTFEGNRVPNCFRTKNGDWIIPIHYARFFPEYPWSAPQGESKALPEYKNSQVSFYVLWDTITKRFEAGDYLEHEGAYRFELAPSELLEAYRAHHPLRRLCMIEDWVKAAQRQGINASWALQRECSLRHEDEKIEMPSRLIICIAPDESPIKVYPNQYSIGEQKMLAAPIPLPLLRSDEAFLLEIEKISLEYIQNPAAVKKEFDIREPKKDTLRSLAGTWFCKHLTLEPYSRGQYSDVMIARYAQFRFIKFETPYLQQIWDRMMSKYDREVLFRRANVDNFSRDGYPEYKHQLSVNEIRFINDYGWVFKMHGVEYSHDYKNGIYQGTLRTDHVKGTVHNHIDCPPFFKLQLTSSNSGEFASPAAEPYSIGIKGRAWLAQIYIALSKKGKSIRIPCTHTDGPELVGLQNAFYAHGVFGLVLKPLAIGAGWVEISLEGLESAVPKNNRPSSMFGRHTELTDQQTILRHGKVIAHRNLEGYVRVRTQDEIDDFPTVERVLKATSGACIRNLTIAPKAERPTQRRIVTLLSHDEGHGKTQWRNKLTSHCPESLIHSHGRFVMLPGWGKEADSWLDAGVNESRLVLVEREEHNIEHLKRRYPYATIIHGDIRKRSTWRAIRRGGIIAAVSIDPYSGPTKGFIDPLAKGIQVVSHMDEFYLALNLQSKVRGTGATREFLNGIQRKHNLPKNASAVHLAWRHCLPTALRSNGHPEIGHYSGDQSHTIMTYALGMGQR